MLFIILSDSCWSCNTLNIKNEYCVVYHASKPGTLNPWKILAVTL